MIKINGKNITMTRGDTLKVAVHITDATGDEYKPAQGDTIRFAMKKNYSDTNVLLLKEIPTDTLILHLEPEDTKTLKMPQNYVYDIQLTHENGDVDTFIANAIFSIVEEVD